MSTGRLAYEAARTERLSRRPSDQVVEWADLNDGTRSMWDAAAQAVSQEARLEGYREGLKGFAEEIAKERQNTREAIERGRITSGPTGYEVWRDALTLAVDHSAEGAEITPNAFWFHGLLKAGYDGARQEQEQTRITETEAAADPQDIGLY